MATPSVAPQPSAPVPRRGNPLRRRTDALRFWVRVLFAAALGIAVALTVLLGLHLYADGRAQAARQAAGLHRVDAVAATQPVSAGVDTWIATLTWTDNGRSHREQAPVPPATAPGDHVTVWVDAQEVPQPDPIPAPVEHRAPKTFVRSGPVSPPPFAGRAVGAPYSGHSP